jgi:hypothetical protein
MVTTNTARREEDMSRITRKSLEEILGPLDQKTCADIQTTGATLKDVEEAKAILDGRSDITGSGEQVIPGPVREVLTILSGKRAGT